MAATDRDTIGAYTTAEAAAFLGRDEAFVRERLASGALRAAADGTLTRAGLLAFLAEHHPRRLALIEIAQDAVDNGEYDITLERLRELGIITGPPPGEDGADGDAR